MKLPRKKKKSDLTDPIKPGAKIYNFYNFNIYINTVFM